MSQIKSRGTPAQRALLGWLVRNERGGPREEWRGRDLIPYYRLRKEAVDPEFYDKFPGQARGGYADHGWRRAGGTALKHLADCGFLVATGMPHGVPVYSLTEEGRAIGTEVNQSAK